MYLEFLLPVEQSFGADLDRVIVLLNVLSNLSNSNSLGDRKMLELQALRITEIRTVKVFFFWKIFKGPESLVRINKSLNCTSST